MDQIRKRLPALFDGIRERRAQDPCFAEICDDLETLVAILETKDLDLEPQALQNILESIRGLENEISASIALSVDAAKLEERKT